MNLTHGFVEFDTHFTCDDGRGCGVRDCTCAFSFFVMTARGLENVSRLRARLQAVERAPVEEELCEVSTL